MPQSKRLLPPAKKQTRLLPPATHNPKVQPVIKLKRAVPRTKKK